MSVIADTSGLLALLDADHALHGAVRHLAQQEAIIVPSSVLPEVDYMATKRLDSKTAQTFLQDVLAGDYTYAQVDFIHLARVTEIMEDYADAAIGFVDASIVTLAERYQIRRILTLDRRHFSMFRPKGLDYLELLP